MTVKEFIELTKGFEDFEIELNVTDMYGQSANLFGLNVTPTNIVIIDYSNKIIKFNTIEVL